MRDIKIVKIADDGLITFDWTGEEATGFDLLLQQLYVSLLSDTRDCKWGTFVGGNLKDLTTYTDYSELSAELSSRIDMVCRQIMGTHPDFHGASLEGLDVSGDSVRVYITVATDYGKRYIKIPMGA